MKTAEESIKLLREMQSQIIHGKNTFGEIADVIEKLLERDTQWCEKWKLAVETNGSNCGSLLDAERSGYERGVREAAASDCVNHVPACHCSVCEFNSRILSLLTKPKDKE